MKLNMWFGRGGQCVQNEHAACSLSSMTYVLDIFNICVIYYYHILLVSNEL